ncbi:hypothetical protein ACXR0O_16745 [Verrucomicrobiota bacterium sgz303538]
MSGIVPDIVRDPGAINRAAPGIAHHAARIISDRPAITDDVQRITHDTWRISRDTPGMIV